MLAGLFGIAVALGALGRVWQGPAALLTHLGSWATAGVAAVAAVLVNNLPAASLLAARTPGHPFALLVGLNIGPNLLASGSLAWILWLKSARTAGADPSLRRASRLGAITGAARDGGRARRAHADERRGLTEPGAAGYDRHSRMRLRRVTFGSAAAAAGLGYS